MTIDKDVKRTLTIMVKRASMQEPVPACGHRFFSARLPKTCVQRDRIHLALQEILGRQLSRRVTPLKLKKLRSTIHPTYQVLILGESEDSTCTTKLVVMREQRASLVPAPALLALDSGRSHLEWLTELYSYVANRSEYLNGFYTNAPEIRFDKSMVRLWNTWLQTASAEPDNSAVHYLDLALSLNWRSNTRRDRCVYSNTVNDMAQELRAAKMAALSPFELVQLMIAGGDPVVKHVSSYMTPNLHFPGLLVEGATASLVPSKRRHILWKHPWEFAFSCHVAIAARR